jgi:hypothetical protein
MSPSGPSGQRLANHVQILPYNAKPEGGRPPERLEALAPAPG